MNRYWKIQNHMGVQFALIAVTLVTVPCTIAGDPPPYTTSKNTLNHSTEGHSETHIAKTAKPCCAVSAQRKALAGSTATDESWLGLLFNTADFPPRWYCGTWTAMHGWIHIIADIAIFAAYFTIPMLLIFFVRHRPNFPFPRVFWLFAAFILSCGTVHLIEAAIFWFPWYRFSAFFKVITALVSWATIIALIPIIPRALKWPKITELNKKLEQEINARRGSEERLRSMIKTLQTSAVMINRQSKIVFVNPATMKLFGYTAEELLGNTVEMLIPERFRDQHRYHVTGYFDTPDTRPGAGRDFYGRRKDGSEVPIEIALTPVYDWPESDENGRKANDTTPVAMATVVDITHRKLYESGLRHHAKILEQKNEELNQFTYFASHDLQEPLRKLTSFSTLLKSDIGRDLPKRAENDIKFIIDAAKRMETLVQDLLRFSRSGRTDMILKSVSLKDCVRRVLDTLDAKIKTAGALIEYDELPSAEIDLNLMTQVYQNLIGNALKYKSPNRIPVIKITAKHGSGGWVFGVQDNRIGIESEYVKQIFAPFKRLHSRDKYEGTGIGLAICQKVVERHGGRLWVESVHGEGSHFKFTLAKNKEVSSCGEKCIDELMSC